MARPLPEVIAAVVAYFQNRRPVPGEPPVSMASTREELIAWCSWNDAGGCYSDEDCDAEGMPRTDLDTAWRFVAYHLGEYVEGGGARSLWGAEDGNLWDPPAEVA